MNREKLRKVGWKAFFEQQIQADLAAEVTVARVSAHHRSQVIFIGDQGEFSVPTQLAEAAGEVTVGDWLLLDGDCRAMQRLERQTVIARKAPGKDVRQQLIAANIDTIFIVSSCNEDYNLSRIERYLALTIQSGVTPIVVLTKSDLCTSAADLRRQVEKLKPGLLVETLDARDANQADALLAWCGLEQSVALVGSSGVGKSTLANAMGASDLATARIREKDGKGRHTTTSRSLHQLPSGGVLIDNPGMRELQLPACEDGVAGVFDDVFQLAELCRFSDCRHEGDAGCAVQAAVESGSLDPRRFRSFQKLQAEQERNSRTLAEQREVERGFGRMCKAVIKEKRQRR